MPHVMTTEERTAIIEAYRAGKQTIELARMFTRDRSAITLLLQRAGVHDPTRPKSNQVTCAEIEQKAVAAYQAGKTTEEVAREIGVSHTTVRRILARNGVATRPVGRASSWTEERKALLRSLYEQGMKQQEIAVQLGVTPSTVCKMLTILGMSSASDVRRQRAVSEKLRCNCCGEIKARDEFSVNNSALSGRCGMCRECVRWKGRLGKYGITREQYQDLYTKQNGKCASCGCVWAGTEMHPDLVVDHDHKTGAVRGLLCPDCNNILGLANDSQTRLDAAKAYLQRSAAQTATPEPS